MSVLGGASGVGRTGHGVFPKLLAVKQELLENGELIKQKAPAPDEEPTCWTIFVDELAMPKRPDVDAASSDREIFAKKLPKSITTEEELKKWLRADFGPIEHVLVLRDDLLSTPDSVGYIRFEEHRAAKLFMDAQGGDGSLASWSEAERASKRTKSVYGSDVHTAFLGQEGDGLRRILLQSGAKQLWLQSEVQKPTGENIPASAMEGPYAPQLHFSITCTAEQLKKIKLALTEVLEDFHDRTERLLRCYGGGKQEKTIQEFDETIGEYVDVKVPVSAPSNKEDTPVPSLGKNLVWDSATGKYLEEDLPEDIQDLICLNGPATEKELEKVKQMVKVKQEFANHTEKFKSAPETPLNGWRQESNQQKASPWQHYPEDGADQWHDAKRPRTNGVVGGNEFKVLFSGRQPDSQHQQWQNPWQNQKWQDPRWQPQSWHEQEQNQQQWHGQNSLGNASSWQHEQEWTQPPSQQGQAIQQEQQHELQESQWSAPSVQPGTWPGHYSQPSSHAPSQQHHQQYQQQQQQGQQQQAQYQSGQQRQPLPQPVVQQQTQQQLHHQVDNSYLQQLQQQQEMQQQKEALERENERLQQEWQQQQMEMQRLQQQEALLQQQRQNERLQQEWQQQQLLQQQMQQQMQQQWQQQQLHQQLQQQQQQQLEWQRLEMQRLQLQNMLGFSPQMNASGGFGHGFS